MKRPVTIILLIVALVIVCGGILTVAWAGLIPVLTGGLQMLDNRVSASADETKTVEPGDITALRVENQAGDVVITGADVEEITVEVHKTSWASNQAQAEEELKNIKYEILQQGDTLVLRYELPNQGIKMSENPNTVDFNVTVPNEIEVITDGGFGRVELSNIQGNADLKSDFGEITVENLEGSLKVDTQSGTVSATSIAAGANPIEIHSGFGNITLEKATANSVTLDSQSGRLEVTDVRSTGNVEISTQFGDISFGKGSARALTVKTESGKVTLNSLNVNGALTAASQFGAIELEKVKAASYEVTSQSGQVDLDGVQDNVKVEASFGGITVINAENATLDLHTQSGSVEFEGSLGDGPHTIHSDFGAITLTIPADSALNVDIETDFGNITSDIPISVILSGAVDQSRQTGTMNGGGPDLKVSTQSGGITIQALEE